MCCTFSSATCDAGALRPRVVDPDPEGNRQRHDRRRSPKARIARQDPAAFIRSGAAAVVELPGLREPDRRRPNVRRLLRACRSPTTLPSAAMRKKTFAATGEPRELRQTVVRDSYPSRTPSDLRDGSFPDGRVVDRAGRAARSQPPQRDCASVIPTALSGLLSHHHGDDRGAA